MKNPLRRKRLLKVIEAVWSKNNDLRLMQLLLNVCVDCETYSIEDDTLEKILKQRYLEENI